MHVFFRQTLFPLFLIITCPPTALIFWHVNCDLQGSLLAFYQEIQQQGFFTALYQLWQPVFWGTARAWAIISVFGITQLLLMRFVPGKRFLGPITPKGQVPVYKANGVPCYLISLSLFFLGTFVFHLFSASILYDNFIGLLGALNMLSLVFCLFLYVKGRFFPSSADHSTSGNVIFDYYWGTELYPRLFGWDVKQFTNCRFGMMSWPLIILSFSAKQAESYGLSNSMLIALILMLVYVTKFFYWETGYLSSLDIMHDRAGFYICWGCLVWVPAIYTSPIAYLVHHPYHFNLFLSALIVGAGIASVMINYWADAQRQKARATHGQCKIWGKPAKFIRVNHQTETGEAKQSLLLTSGWWGLSRHFHYLPEMLSAFFWTLPALFFNFIPWFYVIFLTILLLHRARRDEARCRKKYGPYWEQYCQLVPNRILPHWSRKNAAGSYEQEASHQEN